MKRFLFILILNIFLNLLVIHCAFADIGSSEWIFPACYKGTFPEYGIEATFWTRFYLYYPNPDPNAPPANIMVRVYKAGGGNNTVDYPLSLPPRKPTRVLHEDLNLPSNVNRFSVRIFSLNGERFIAHKLVQYVETPHSSRSFYATLGAEQAETKWYFPVNSKESTVSKDGCTQEYSINRPLNFKTRYVFYFNDNSVSPMNINFTFIRSDGQVFNIPFSIPPNNPPLRRYEYDVSYYQLDGYRFSAIIENTSGVPMVVERVMYYDVPGTFSETSYFPTPSVSLGEASSEIGISDSKLSTTYYSPHTGQDCLDENAYVTILNPDEYNSTNLTIELMRSVTFQCDEYYVKECSPGNYELTAIISTIPLGPKKMIRLNLARLFTNEEGTQYPGCSKTSVYPKCRARGIKISSSNGIKIAVESEFFFNSKTCWPWYNFDNDSFWDYEDYCSVLQWDTGVVFQGDTGGKTRWFIPFLGGYPSGNSYSWGTYISVISQASNAVFTHTLRFYVIDDDGKLVPLMDDGGSGNFYIEKTLYSGILSDVFDIREVGTSSNPACQWNSGLNSYGKKYKMCKTDFKRGYVVIESKDNLPFTVQYASQFDWHVPGGYFHSNMGGLGYGTTGELSDPNLITKPDYAVLNVNPTSLRFNVSPGGSSDVLSIIVKNINDLPNFQMNSTVLTITYDAGSPTAWLQVSGPWSQSGNGPHIYNFYCVAPSIEGTYYATISVRAYDSSNNQLPNSPVCVRVTLTVSRGGSGC